MVNFKTPSGTPSGSTRGKLLAEFLMERLEELPELPVDLLQAFTVNLLELFVKLPEELPEEFLVELLEEFTVQFLEELGTPRGIPSVTFREVYYEFSGGILCQTSEVHSTEFLEDFILEFLMELPMKFHLGGTGGKIPKEISSLLDNFHTFRH